MNAPPIELSVPGAEIRGNKSCSYQFPHLNHNANLNFKSNFIVSCICSLNPNFEPYVNYIPNPTLDHCFKLLGGHCNQMRVRLQFEIYLVHYIIQMIVVVKICWKYFLYCTISYMPVCTFCLH